MVFTIYELDLLSSVMNETYIETCLKLIHKGFGYV